MSDSYQRAVKQAEFLNRLSKLMNEYQAEFSVDDRGDDGNWITVDACGSWVPYHDARISFDVDDCIKATAATIEHAKALAPVPMRVFKIGEVAKICKVAPRSVSKWFDSGKLKGYRIPGSQDRRIPYEYLVAFLKQYGMEELGREANLLPSEFVEAALAALNPEPQTREVEV